jgi:hypothetical protein
MIKILAISGGRVEADVDEAGAFASIESAETLECVGAESGGAVFCIA